MLNYNTCPFISRLVREIWVSAIWSTNPLRTGLVCWKKFLVWMCNLLSVKVFCVFFLWFFISISFPSHSHMGADMSCYPKTLLRWCPKTSWCRRRNGGRLASNSHRVGYTTWYTNLSHTYCSSEDPSLTHWPPREHNRYVCESFGNSLPCSGCVCLCVTGLFTRQW